MSATPKSHTQLPQSLFDLVVIGSGPAGQRAAIQGAKAGKRVAIIEEYDRRGGACVHWGTLPSKSFRESVYRYSLSSRGSLGQEKEHHVAIRKKRDELPDFRRLVRRAERVVDGEAAVIDHQLARNGVKLINGKAKLVGTHEIEVEGERGKELLKTSVIIIATGARPVAPSHISVDGKQVHDSNTILNLKEMPRSLAVLGAGIIGCEYASMFSMAGTKVHLIDRRQEILASVDREIVKQLVGRFETDGLEIFLGCEATKLERDSKKGGLLQLHLNNGKVIGVEQVLVAQGRFGNTQGLGCEAVGIEVDERGLIRVDSHFRTKVPHIYAVGDVIGPPALASTAFEQGRIATCHAFQLADGAGYADFTMPRLFPYGIYTIPEISMLGATEEELKEDKIDYVVGRARYAELARGQIVGDAWGLLKLLVDRKSLKLLGVHIIGDSAADLIHIGQAVMFLGADVNYFIHTVFNYPTLAEAYKTAAFHAVNQIKGTTSRVD